MKQQEPDLQLISFINHMLAGVDRQADPETTERPRFAEPDPGPSPFAPQASDKDLLNYLIQRINESAKGIDPNKNDPIQSIVLGEQSYKDMLKMDPDAATRFLSALEGRRESTNVETPGPVQPNPFTHPGAALADVGRVLEAMYNSFRNGYPITQVRQFRP